MNWIELSIKTDGKFEDLISDKLYNFGSIGVNIDNPLEMQSYIEDSKDTWDFIDIKLKNNKNTYTIIKAYFENINNIKDDIDKLIGEIEVIVGEDSLETEINEVDDEDWNENWKNFFQTLEIGKRIIIKPTWEEVENRGNDIIINLDPGMAFGTGSHETTYMCAEELEKHMKTKDIVYDIGCGSGILSIVAAKLGAKSVLAIDLDDMCVKTTKENTELNYVSDIVEVKKGNLLDVVRGRANIIVANIVAEVIVMMLEQIVDYIEDDGIIITSGIIIDKIDMVRDAFINKGLKIIEIKTMNEWACIVAQI